MKFIDFKIQDHVAQLRLNRPEVRNAFKPEMIAEIRQVFENDIARDKSLRAVVLSGAGASFSAGGDLEWMKSMAQFSFEQNQQDARDLFAMYQAMKDCEVPLLGKIHGHAMGGGVGLTAVCDIVAAESSTKFALSEVRLGIVPAVISPFVLDKISVAWAHRYMLTGDQFSAQEAMTAGLVHFVGEQKTCDLFIQNILASLFDSGPEAVRETKKLLKFCLREKDSAKVQTECTKIIAERRSSAEGQEGLSAFLNKAKASFKVVPK